MALGKNLKKKALITSEPEKVEKKPTSKKKVVAKKKVLIKKPKTVPVIEIEEVAKKTAPKKKASQAQKEQPKAEEINSGLPMFIAQEIYDKKVKLRNRYEEEINGLKGKVVQFVSFLVGGESYAVSIDAVKEVVPIPNLSKTPNTPNHIKGIANIRGNTYVVFDLASKFKIVGEEFARYLLVVKDQGIKASLMLSSLPITFKISGNEISSSLHMIEDATLDISFIKGLIKHEEKLIYYLDIVELLKNDKAIIVPNNMKDRE